MNATLKAASAYVAAGLSVHPIRVDGSKAPQLKDWTRYADLRPTEAELKQWFNNGMAAGIGILGGPASGNLAVLDFETVDSWDRWLSSVPSDTVDFLDDCPTVKTPRPGMHLYVRLSDPVRGTVLARNKEGKTLIETRGYGQYVVAPGSPPGCHRTGRLYEFNRRGWIEARSSSVVPMNVFAEWCALVVELNEWKPRKTSKPTLKPRERAPGDTEPGTDFNRRGTWEESGLFDADWTWVSQFDAESGNICRPGKRGETSGTLGICISTNGGWPLFKVFTTNAPPFEAETTYDRFGVFARLKHRGDFTAAARALYEMGYGDQERGKVKQTIKSPKLDSQAAFVTETATKPNVPDSNTAVAIIAAHYRQHYRPDFRRGNAIHSEAGEIVPMGVACEVPTSKLIEQLAEATDAPRFPGGVIKRDSLPGFFKRWARVAWGDLLASLPDEDTATLPTGSSAADEFRRLIRDAMFSEIVLGNIIGKNDVTRTERRSLIDWCAKFAKPGPWKAIRSKKCWCKIEEVSEGEIRLKVAIRHEVFAQVKADRRLIEMGANTFTRRAAKYGIGTSAEKERPHGQRAVILADDFVSDLTAGLNLDEWEEDL